MRRKAIGSMSLRIHDTWPSIHRALQPLPWKLYGSSLTPQLFWVQGQAAGPPNGMELLLIILRPGSPYSVLTLKVTWNLGPETPLAVSGSAQRHAARKPPLSVRS